MANRTFVQANYCMLKGLVRLYPVIQMTASVTVPVLQKRTFTAAGTSATSPANALAAAPTTGVGYAVGDAAGTRSIARTGTGAWTLTLSDPYLYLVGVTIIGFSSVTGISTVIGVGVVSGSTTITTNTSNGSGGVIALQLIDESGAADPGTIGDQFTLEVILGNAGEP